jgi:hypothetical protein
MRNQVLGWVGIMTLILSNSAVAQFRGRGQREARENGWLNNYQTAREEARKADKPIMLVFRCVP